MSVEALLKRVTQGPKDRPLRVCLYGQEGIGKSTWAAGAPKPIFLCVEDGLGPALDHVARLNIESWDELVRSVEELAQAKGRFKTLVIDTADAMEEMLTAKLLRENNVPSLNDMKWGKGHNLLRQGMEALRDKLTLVRDKAEMNVVFLAHAAAREIEDTTGESVWCSDLRMTKRGSEVIRDWVDILLYARFEIFTRKTKTGKAVGMGEQRVVETEPRSAWKAKNRHNLPPQLELTWASLAAGIEYGGSDAQRKALALECTHLWDVAVWDGDSMERAYAFVGTREIGLDAFAQLPTNRLQQIRHALLNRQPATEAPETPPPTPTEEA